MLHLSFTYGAVNKPAKPAGLKFPSWTLCFAFLRAFLEFYRETFGQERHTELLIAMNQKPEGAPPAGGHGRPNTQDARPGGGNSATAMIEEIEKVEAGA